MSENWEVSNIDLRHLVYEIAKRLPDLDHFHQRMRGLPLVHPKSLDNDMKLFERLVNRHKLGDYRHKQSELLATRNIAQWTLDVNCELRNQPKQTLIWRD